MLFSRSSKDRGGSSVRPNVSITPISDSSVTIGDSESSKNRGVATTGIEIIPLGAALTTGAGSQLKSKVPFHWRTYLSSSSSCLLRCVTWSAACPRMTRGGWTRRRRGRGRRRRGRLMLLDQVLIVATTGPGTMNLWSGKYCSEANTHLVQENLGAAGYWEWSSGLVVAVNRWNTNRS